MEVLLILVSLGFLIAAVYLHRSADKSEHNFANRPSTITNPSEDLYINQKYAIVGLLAFVQGATPQSAYNSEASRIVQSTIFSLGLSKSDVEKHLKISMNRDPERQICQMINSLKEIRDHKYIEDLFQKALTIAEISGDRNTIIVTKEIFGELGL